jgi:hypothetical protein
VFARYCAQPPLSIVDCDTAKLVDALIVYPRVVWYTVSVAAELRVSIISIISKKLKNFKLNPQNQNIPIDMAPKEVVEKACEKLALKATKYEVFASITPRF